MLTLFSIRPNFDIEASMHLTRQWAHHAVSFSFRETCFEYSFLVGHKTGNFSLI